ncbi:MAG: GNAT family N-acetyltransferase [Proteobacteria bacterium]|nr:MAG: GNAT family N-acetyltransferase [Pseudomonadota bacterium]
MPAIEVRPLQQSDHADWRRLWTAYLEFYETTVPEEVYRTTWERLFTAGEFEPKGFLALIDGKAVGLTHYIYHRSCWSIVNNCYLQDLFADPDVRGKGVGAALIEAVRREAAKIGVSKVFWVKH